MVVEIVYGHIRGGASSYSLPMGASEYIRARSGKFVAPDDSPTTRRGEIAGDGDTTIMGWVDAGEQQCSSTEGATVLKCIDDLTAVFRLPLFYDNLSYTANYSDILIGTKHDLILKNRIQYANLTDSDEETIIIVGGQAASAAVADGAVADAVYGDGWVDVRINPTNVHIANS